MIKLVALDLDGTLLDEEKRIPVEIKRRLLDLKEKGVKIVLATGRTFESAKRYYYELELDTPFIGCNGGLVYLPDQKQVIFGKVFEQDDFYYVASLLTDLQVYYQFYGLDCIYARELAYGVKRWKCENVDLPEHWRMKIELVDDPLVWARESYRPVYKILARFESEEQMAGVREAIEGMRGLDSVSSFANALDIGPDQCTKGKALEWVCGLLGVGLDETLAMGDHDNDSDMIEKAGIGIAVGQASRTARSVADICLLRRGFEEISEVFKRILEDSNREERKGDEGYGMEDGKTCR